LQTVLSRRSSVTLDEAGVDFDAIDLSKWFISGEGDIGDNIDHDDLTFWSEHLVNWQKVWKKSPTYRTNDDDKLQKVILCRIERCGIPCMLKGELWPTLVSIDERTFEQLERMYRTFGSKQSDYHDIITADLPRTFPTHPKFNENGRRQLYRVLNAYSIYDNEVGYCQGMNFIVATLLVQMPEETAFACFVCFMFRYNLRSLYNDHFEGLTRNLFFIEKLIKSGSDKMRRHLTMCHIEPGMYAHQWLLSWFCCRFPLTFSTRVIDLLALDRNKSNTVLVRLTVCLMLAYKHDVLACDIDKFMSYFRYVLPMRFSPTNCEQTDTESPELSVHLKEFLNFYDKYRLTSFRLAQLESEWKATKTKIKLPNAFTDNEKKRLRSENSDLKDENEELRRQNEGLKDQLETLSRQWTEITVSDCRNMSPRNSTSST